MTDGHETFLEFIKERSLILSLDENNAVKAGETAEKEGLYLIDGIIHSYVDEHAYLLTGIDTSRINPLSS